MVELNVAPARPTRPWHTSGMLYDDVWPEWGFHVVAEEEAGVRGLVVADVLGGDGEAILRVVHQGGDAVVGGNCCCVNSQGVVVGGAENHFFAPVAEEVGAEDECGL